jgi:glycosyltransferase Alg8
MSVFRAKHLLDVEFIRLMEADYLDNWLWGQFRFLSGDDKSTWYYMLSRGAKLLFVPDAVVYTVENVEGSGVERMIQNLRRWSGNTLRSGTRTLNLGPRKVGFFVWWCVLDQRIAMWTALVGPVLAVLVATLISPAYLISFALWIALSRFVLALVLFSYSRRIDIAYLYILYPSQIINASVKVYAAFHLAKQRWTNRGDQAAGFQINLAARARTFMAAYLTILYLTIFVLGVAHYSGILDRPSITMINAFVGT